MKSSTLLFRDPEVHGSPDRVFSSDSGLIPTHARKSCANTPPIVSWTAIMVQDATWRCAVWNLAIERASRFGAGICLAARTTHWGRAHAYAGRAAREGMIGLCTTNAIPSMLAWGSTGPLLGNNPLAIAIPRGPDRDPIVLDMAMSQAAVGKVGTYLREGRAVPTNWGLDSSGQPTDNPAEIIASRKFLPMGEHKGAGLAIMMELLTGALSGGLFSHEIARLDSSTLDPNASKLFVAIDVAPFLDPGRFAARVKDLITYLHESAEAGREILYPGERGWKTRDRNLAEGTPIHTKIAAQLRTIGVNLPG